jgi:endonuclease III
MATKLTPKDVERVLTERYAPPRWLFGLPENKYGSDEWRLRQLTADILVSGTHEEKAIRSSEEIWSRYTFEELSESSILVSKAKTQRRRAIADLLDKNGVRFAGRKADYLLDTMTMIRAYCDGKVPKKMGELTTLPGVGRHVAQVTQHLGHGITDVFGIDLHVRRIVKRMGLVPIASPDSTIESLFRKECSNPGRVSRAFVDFGKDVCSYVPQCQRCPFAKGCERVDFT